MNKEEFDPEKIKESLGCAPRKYEEYDYEKYKRINPKLTEETYKHLYSNHGLWKIVCGQEVSTHWGMILLERVWYLDLPGNYDRRFLHGWDGYEW